MHSCCRTCSWVAWLPDAWARSAGDAPQDPAAVHAAAPSGHTSAGHQRGIFRLMASCDRLPHLLVLKIAAACCGPICTEGLQEEQRGLRAILPVFSGLAGQ